MIHTRARARRRPTRTILTAHGALWVLLCGPSFSCGPGGLAQRAARSPSLEDTGLQQRTADPLCLDGNRPTKPLVVDWTSSDRSELEAAVNRGVVVMKYTGCQLEVVPGCSAPGSYVFAGVTPKRDAARIQNRGELYGLVPTSAAKLEARLKRWGQLNVEMTILGRYEASQNGIRTNELEGSCLGATHVARAVVAGSFRFTAGAGADLSAGVQVHDVAGVGGSSTSEREVLSEDGDARYCTPVPAGYIPPTGCNAMIRVEVDPLLTPEGVPVTTGLGVDGRQRESTGNPRRVMLAGATLTGLGVAAAGLIAGGAVMAHRAEEEFRNDPAQREQADRNGATANGLIVGGAVGAAVFTAIGVPLIIVGRKQMREIELSAGPRMGGLTIQGRF
jgi:hypothetical protein